MKNIDITVVVPVYNSEAVLTELHSQIDTVMRRNDFSYDLIFVCDNSPDKSWDVISQLASKYHNVKGVLLRLNAGQHNALMAGITRAHGRIVITMDDDLQHSPSDIPKLVSELESGYDLVYVNFNKRKHAVWKSAGSSFNNIVASRLLDKPKDLYLSPYRAFRSALIDDIARYKGPFVYLDGLLLSTTANISSVDGVHNKRYAGESNYGLVKSISLWMKMAVNFSIQPLRLTSILGVIMSSVGFFLAVILVVQKFTYDAMPTGWTSLIVTILLVGGIQLFALGMLGEYLGRTLLTINAKPQYVVDKDVGF